MQIITFDKIQKNTDFKLIARQLKIIKNLIIVSTREGVLELDVKKIGDFSIKTKHRALTKKKLRKRLTL